MKATALLISKDDNVVTVLKEMAAGEEVIYYDADNQLSRIVTSGVPVYHKIARCAIRAGESIVKYGQEVGVATRDIQAGEHVHTQNIKSKVQ